MIRAVRGVRCVVVNEMPLGRLVADFERTTGQRMDLRLHWRDDLDMWQCVVVVDGVRVGSTGVPNIEDGSEEDLAHAVDWLCEYSLHEDVTWGGWPLCPRHPTRPMWAQTDEHGQACWVCEADPTDRAVIGELGL